jgi:hypothetical protein
MIFALPLGLLLELAPRRKKVVSPLTVEVETKEM